MESFVRVVQERELSRLERGGRVDAGAKAGVEGLEQLCCRVVFDSPETLDYGRGTGGEESAGEAENSFAAAEWSRARIAGG